MAAHTLNQMNGTPAAQAPRLRSVQEFRAIAALMVIACHLADVAEKYCHTTNLFLSTLEWWGTLGVDFFFLISGVVIYEVAWPRLGSAAHAVKFLYRRLTRIYPIYWFYTTIALAVYLRHPAMINHGSLSRASILPSYLLTTVHYGLLIGQAWTLLFEIIFYLVFTLLIAVSSKRTLPWLLTAWAAIILICTIPAIATSWLVFTPLVLEFLMGCLIAGCLQRGRLGARWGVMLLLAGLAGTVTSTLWVIHAGMMVQMADARLRVPLFGVPFACILLGVLVLERSGRLSRRAWMETIGDWSYSIYLMHLLVINAIFHFAVGAWPGLANRAGAGALALLSLAAILLGGWASYRYLERPLLRHAGRVADWIW